MKGPGLLLITSVFVLLVIKVVSQDVGNESPCYVEICEEGEETHHYEWTDPGIFDGLSAKEVTNVITYLMAQPQLNLVLYEEATPSDSYIFLIEHHLPTKSQVLAHRDDGQAIPPREAKVIIHRGDLAIPVVVEYKVGPLPSPTYHSALNDPIPFHARSFNDDPQLSAFHHILHNEMLKIDHILDVATDGYKFNDCGNKCIKFLPTFTPSLSSGERKMWIHCHRSLEGGYLYPIGLQIQFDLMSVNASEWSIIQIWFQGVYFTSLEEIIQQYNSGEFVPQKVDEPNNAQDKSLPSSMNFRGDPFPQKPRSGPRSYSPNGQRYKVDGHRIEWQGWSFNFNVRTSSGLQVHDLRFLTERIAYEISLQDVIVLYGGGGPSSMHTNYFDSLTLIGRHNSQLFRGVDCPYDATFFHFVHYIHGIPHYFKDAVCVFELDKGLPLRRHYDYDQNGGYHWFQGMPDVVLILRTIATFYNYDYIIDVILHQGGQVEVKTSLTGYTHNTFYTGPEMDEYGFQTQKDSLANIHHHMINFKVDLDILGTENCMESLDISLEEISDPTNQGSPIYNRKFERNLKTNEKDAAYQFSFDTPKYLIVYNDKAPTTKYGQKRGYRIAPVDVSKQLLPGDYEGSKAWSWAKYQVATTKHHDEEDRSSSVYTTADTYDPVVNFQAFIDDDEYIVDQDLVSWITLGAHHLPHTEDVPVVQTPGVQLTFFLLPFNYFDEDVSLASRDNIRVIPNQEVVGDMDYQYSGVKGTTCCNPRIIDGKGTQLHLHIENGTYSASPAIFAFSHQAQDP